MSHPDKRLGEREDGWDYGDCWSSDEKRLDIFRCDFPVFPWVSGRPGLIHVDAWLMKLLAVGRQLWGIYIFLKHITSFCLCCCWVIASLSFKNYEMTEEMLFEVNLRHCRLQNNLAACLPFLSSISQMGVFPLKSKSGVAAFVNVIFLLIILTRVLKIETLLRIRYSGHGKCAANIVTLPLSQQWQTLLKDHSISFYRARMEHWNLYQNSHK